jgi:hypothetical protein
MYGAGDEAAFDGHTVGVRSPMRFQRRGSRKRITAPDGSEIVPAAKPLLPSRARMPR